MLKKGKKYVRNYYGIALITNLIPIVIMLSRVGNIHGEAQMGFIIFGGWVLICALVYAFYFAIPEFNRNWEKIVGLVFPSIILSLILFKFPEFKIAITINLILNGIFILHWKIHTGTLFYKKT
ncbi:hypothetical protein [uncultured Aquimarina sp.]|uniref:hypothetical protein n=1 Tax=uncultured Aquimarina sp. TaxID=575652 RepID=UPI00261692B4|nr:hypothetical protein [uncultured Aquimarina sp.]